MTKDLICIECPRSCVLRVDIENCRVVKVTGEKVPQRQRLRGFRGGELPAGLDLYG